MKYDKLDWVVFVRLLYEFTVFDSDVFDLSMS